MPTKIPNLNLNNNQDTIVQDFMNNLELILVDDSKLDTGQVFNLFQSFFNEKIDISQLIIHKKIKLYPLLFSIYSYYTENREALSFIIYKEPDNNFNEKIIEYIERLMTTFQNSENILDIYTFSILEQIKSTNSKRKLLYSSGAHNPHLQYATDIEWDKENIPNKDNIVQVSSDYIWFYQNLTFDTLRISQWPELISKITWLAKINWTDLQKNIQHSKNRWKISQYLQNQLKKNKNYFLELDEDLLLAELEQFIININNSIFKYFWDGLLLKEVNTKLSIKQIRELLKTNICFNDLDVFQRKHSSPKNRIDYINLEEKSLNNFSIYNDFTSNEIDMIQYFSASILGYEISKSLWINTKELSLQNIIYFLNFLWTKNIQDFNKFKEILEKSSNKLSFLNTFLACSKTPEIWDKILELAQYNWSAEIFEAYTELINLQSEIDTEDIDSLAFLKSIISRWEKLLLDALQKAKSWENLSVDKKYSSELVKSWAFVKALISKNKSWKVLEKNEFNEKCPYYNIETFSGWDNIIQSDDQLDLLSDENYISSEVFSKDDYKMIVNNLKEAYHEIDPEWLNILIANISEDLQNPDVTFYMMRDKNTKKLVSLCKSNKWVQQWELYLGTHYVEQDLRGDFGFWDYVLRLAIQENSNIDILTGSVAVNNPNLERHINYWWFSATEIVFDTDKNWNSSWELFKVDINKNYKYKSKNKYIYSDQEIKQLSWKPEKDNIIAYKCDSQSWYDQEFKEICKNKFNKWYAVTRLFYEKSWAQPDLNQTYIVFEKNEEL